MIRKLLKLSDLLELKFNNIALLGVSFIFIFIFTFNSSSLFSKKVDSKMENKVDNKLNTTIFTVKFESEITKDNFELLSSINLILNNSQVSLNYSDEYFQSYVIKYIIDKNYNDGAEIKFKSLKRDTIKLNLKNLTSFDIEKIKKTQLINKSNLIYNANKTTFTLYDFTTTLRGLNIMNIVFSPFEYLKEDKDYIYLTYYNEIEIALSENSNIDNIENSLNTIEEPFFADIINGKNREYYRSINKISNDANSKKDNKKSKIQSQENSKENEIHQWYNPEVDYYKVRVSKDAIVRFSMSELINKSPDLLNKNTNLLYLISNGKDYPFYIKSNDDKISNDDEFIFYGLKAKGDSTLNDFYTNEQNYYIYLGDKPNNNHLKLKEYKETNNITSNKESFYANYRFEKDSLFGHGFDFADCNHSHGEFWYWDILFTITGKSFNQNLKIYNDYESDSNSKLGIDYKNFAYTNRERLSSVKILNNLTFNLNNNNANSKKFQGLIYDTLENINANNLIRTGNNFINFKADFTLPAERYANNLDTLDGIIGIEAINFEGYVKPIATNGFANLTKKSSAIENKYFVEGFRNSDIIFIDTINNEIAFPNTTQGYTVIANSNTNININNPTTTNLVPNTFVEIIGVNSISNPNSNSSEYSSTNAGFHILYVENNELKSNFSPSLSANELTNFVNKELAVLVINTNTLNDNIQTALINLGVKNIKLNENFSFVGVFSNGKLISENNINLITNLHTFIPANSNNYAAKLYNKPNTNESFIISDNLNFTTPNIEKVNKSTLKDKSNQADLIIITHKNFIEASKEYADYRTEKNNINVMIIDKEDIYTEFSNGKESPQAIKDFLKYAFDNWTGRKLSYVTIIGDASWDPTKKLTTSKSNNWVPVYGWPTTDVWYSLLDNSNDYVSDIGIGRIPINDVQELKDYINKIKEYESQSSKSWMSKVINLSGGKPGTLEINEFYSRRFLWLNEMGRFNLCYDTVNVKKLENTVVGNNQGGEIRGEINKGAFWLSFLGHASANVYDMDGWEVNSLNNKGKYPILSSLSCNTGAFAEPENTYSRSEEYVLTPNKGFIVSLASTFTGFAVEASFIQTRMFTGMSRPDLKLRNIANIFNYGKNNLGTPNSSGIINPRGVDLFYQNNLLGDPLINVYIGSEHDLYGEKEEFSIKNEFGESNFTEGNAKAIISGKIYNNGFNLDSLYKVKITHIYNNKTNETILDKSNICLFDELNFELDIENQIGKHVVIIEFNYDKKVLETDYNNNKIELNFTVFRRSLLIVEPQNNWDVDAKNPEFIYVNPFEGTFNYEIKINKITQDLNEELIYSSKENDINITENRIIFKPEITLPTENVYRIYAKYIDKNNPINEISWQVTNFKAKDLLNDNIQIDLSNSSSLSEGKLEFTNIQDDKVILNKHKFNYEIIGARGSDDGAIPRYIKIQYSDENGKEVVYQDGGNELGFHILKFPALDKGSEPVYRYYNTWDSPTHPNFTAHNELVTFLEDSISNDEYVFIMTMGEASRMPVEWPKTDKGNIDSLRRVINKLGSKSFDKYAWGMTFAYGFKVEDDRIISLADSCELHIPIRMSGEIVQTKSYGSYQSPSINFTRNIQNISFEATENAKLNSIILNNLYDSQRDTLLSINSNLVEKISENKYKINTETLLKANKYNNLTLNFEFNQSKSFIPEYLSNIKFEFEPTNELALVKSKISLDSNNYLRGYNAILNVSIENLSNRFDANNVYLSYSIINSKGKIDSLINLNNINKNTEIEQTIILPTEFLDLNNNISLNLTDNNGNLIFNEMYNFNNNYTLGLNVNEDIIKPIIKLFADNKSIKHRDYVSIKPKFRVELTDNSPLDFNSTHIQFLLNRNLIRELNCLEYNYQNISESQELKSILEFVWEQDLDFGENSVSVRAFDKSGNRADTIEISVFVSRDGKINNLINYPNPTSENSKIKFDILMPRQEAEASILIYDALGNFVRKLDEKVTIGTNEINWDLRSENGNSVSNGRYYYFVIINSNIYFDDASGTILVNY